jgi:hypothetical protein
LDEHEKRCSAGLIAAAGHFSLDESILAYVRHLKELEDERLCKRNLKKNPEDAAMPSKKNEKLARYFEICSRGDPVAPIIHVIPPLPSLPQQETAICEDETALRDESISDNGNDEESSEVSVEHLLLEV